MTYGIVSLRYTKGGGVILQQLIGIFIIGMDTSSHCFIIIIIIIIIVYVHVHHCSCCSCNPLPFIIIECSVDRKILHSMKSITMYYRDPVKETCTTELATDSDKLFIIQQHAGKCLKRCLSLMLCH
jgi:hypothetical protein